jgi:hypothetical protein
MSAPLRLLLATERARSCALTRRRCSAENTSSMALRLVRWPFRVVTSM